MKYQILKPLISNIKRHEVGEVLEESELGFPVSQVPSLVEISAISVLESAPETLELEPVEMVPTSPDVEPDHTQTTPLEGALAASLINLNTATEDELNTLKYVGRAIAQKMISARPFESTAEAFKASGLKPAQWHEILPSVIL